MRVDRCITHDRSDRAQLRQCKFRRQNQVVRDPARILVAVICRGAPLCAGLHSPRRAGALLVYIGFKLVNFKQIRQLWETSRSEVAIYAVTLLVIVCEDLLVGVLVGIMLSAAKLLYRFSHLVLDLENEGVVSRLKMHGSATFLRLPSLAQKLEEVPPSAELHVDFEHLTYIDHACLDLLMNWAKQHESTGGKLVLDWSSLHGRFAADPSEEGKAMLANRTPMPVPGSDSGEAIDPHTA